VVEEGGVNVRPRVAAEGWWVRKERVGLEGVVGGERMEERDERRAVFWERVWRRARFRLLVSRSLVRRARRDSGVGAMAGRERERFCGWVLEPGSWNVVSAHKENVV
jgi:hypothetical protein